MTIDETNGRQRLLAASMVLAFAMVASAKAFRQSWRSRLRPLGVAAFGSVHALGDGASWIWKSVERSPTGCVQTLDVYDACEHLSRAATRTFGEGTAEATAAFERGRSPLIAQGWTGVCTWVGELLSVADAPERERRRAIADRTVKYFSKHVGRLNDAERLGAARAIGSGAVERQARTLGLRLKSRGARWTLSNVGPMASLRFASVISTDFSAALASASRWAVAASARAMASGLQPNSESLPARPAASSTSRRRRRSASDCDSCLAAPRARAARSRTPPMLAACERYMLTAGSVEIFAVSSAAVAEDRTNALARSDRPTSGRAVEWVVNLKRTAGHSMVPVMSAVNSYCMEHPLG